MGKSFDTPLRRARGHRISFVAATLLALSVLSGGMLWLALPNLMNGDNNAIVVKTALIAIAAVIAGYAINRLAVERGAVLTTKGYWAAGVVSVLSILVVGGGMFSATYAGLTFNDVEQLRLEEHGEVLSDFVSETSALAAQAGRIMPAMAAIVADLEQKYACEISESCLSGFSGGGNGPVARAVLEKLGRARTLAQQVQAGAVARDEANEAIGALFAEYQTTASAGELSADERRQALRGIDLKIKQGAAKLEEAMPVALLAAYAGELKAGIQIEGRPEPSAKISGILLQHGQTLDQLLGSIPPDHRDPPAFPKSTGVSETFNYIGHFLPVAAIAAVVELVFPISLWLYTLLVHNWALYRESPPEQSRPSADEAAFKNLMSGPEQEPPSDSTETGEPPLSHPRRLHARHLRSVGSDPRRPRD